MIQSLKEVYFFNEYHRGSLKLESESERKPQLLRGSNKGPRLREDASQLKLAGERRDTDDVDDE